MVFFDKSEINVHEGCRIDLNIMFLEICRRKIEILGCVRQFPGLFTQNWTHLISAGFFFTATESDTPSPSEVIFGYFRIHWWLEELPV